MIIKDFINNEWSCKCNEVTVIQEERSGHFYIWLLPRYNWMTVKFGNSLSSIREMMNYSKENLKTKDNIEEVLFVVSKLKDLKDL